MRFGYFRLKAMHAAGTGSAWRKPPPALLRLGEAID